MPPTEIAPGIPLENLKRLSLESPEGKQFLGTLTSYYPVLFKENAWHGEWNRLVRRSSSEKLSLGKAQNRILRMPDGKQSLLR